MLVCKELSGYDFKGHRTGYDSIHRALGEWIKPPVVATHEVWLEEVAWAPVVLENAQVELHRDVKILVVEGHKLAAGIPKYLGHVVRTIHSANVKELDLYIMQFRTVAIHLSTFIHDMINDWWPRGSQIFLKISDIKTWRPKENVASLYMVSQKIKSLYDKVFEGSNNFQKR